MHASPHPRRLLWDADALKFSDLLWEVWRLFTPLLTGSRRRPQPITYSMAADALQTQADEPRAAGFQYPDISK